MKKVSKKILLLGDFGVGKTSLIRRYVENTFSDDYLTTIGVKISRKNVGIESEKIEVQMLIWDIEGKTETNTMPKAYRLGAAAAIIVADLTRMKTLDSIQHHLEEFRAVNPERPVLVALNKSDIANLPPERQDMIASLIGVSEIEITSAKSGLNVNRLFELTAKEAVRDA